MSRITSLLAVIGLLSGLAALPAAAMESGKMHGMSSHMGGRKMSHHKMHGKAHHRARRVRGHTMMSHKMPHRGEMAHSGKMKGGSTEGGKM
jgi:hypothetical protein